MVALLLCNLSSDEVLLVAEEAASLCASEMGALKRQCELNRRKTDEATACLRAKSHSGGLGTVLNKQSGFALLCSACACASQRMLHTAGP